ncbi:MAG: hypothetical protein DMF59_20555 [Acidobacteria bacterium]|nr:MAG: hypothetical protein DMF59_20555 [Acidobacteriota bacterium]
MRETRNSSSRPRRETCPRLPSASWRSTRQPTLQKGVALPAVVNKEQNEAADTLSKKVGKDFDHAYMTDMIKDHEKDVSEFKQASLNLTDPDLRAWATRTLPVLQDHLKMAKTTESKLK